jgi:hypothetical protein
MWICHRGVGGCKASTEAEAEVGRSSGESTGQLRSGEKGKGAVDPSRGNGRGRREVDLLYLTIPGRQGRR